jgi:hypothetical protein
MKYPVVYVVWKDSTTHGEVWVHSSNFGDRKLAVCHSLGFLVYEDEEAVHVSTTWVEGSELAGDPDIVPKFAILYRVELDVADYVPPKQKRRSSKYEIPLR